MSELDSIKSEKKAKRVLTGVRFDFTGAHLAYTDESQGFAASEKNDAYLFKSDEQDLKLTENQEKILAELEEEPTPLDKQLAEGDTKDTHSSFISGDGEDKLKNKEEDQMSTEISKAAYEDLQRQVQELQKANNIMKAKTLLAKYNFEEELENSMAEAMVSLDSESVATVEKALDALVTRAEEAVNKAEEAVEKSAKKEEENPLAKALEEEVGHDEAQEVVQKSLADTIKEKREKIEGAK